MLSKFSETSRVFTCKDVEPIMAIPASGSDTPSPTSEVTPGRKRSRANIDQGSEHGQEKRAKWEASNTNTYAVLAAGIPLPTVQAELHHTINRSHGFRVVPLTRWLSCLEGLEPRLGHDASCYTTLFTFGLLHIMHT